jgi:hypothetical protein
MKKILNITSLLLIVFIVFAFVNYRYLNIGFLSLNSLDEYAFHGSLLNMYEGLTNYSKNIDNISKKDLNILMDIYHKNEEYIKNHWNRKRIEQQPNK